VRFEDSKDAGALNLNNVDEEELKVRLSIDKPNSNAIISEHTVSTALRVHAYMRVLNSSLQFPSSLFCLVQGSSFYISNEFVQ
jgi:hypothetical protein